ncbi:2-(1,2-epoxy-1,2-dihydrophenyl)acetyl-CoA isomerase PaaG [Shewanella woodyi]|uniref:Phenylacetate degradation, enoyl-CoA hydratase paaB n=1 Tax=Shewanella woodyi (strain ATCC 51908 / MS32) TaxID=392500 RepID=B1KMB2_SHEWM|nr:2-(1,2-epoxy-1,2-dihydrophenyl)acetyl-CoA isomerase PaaG [Shewanella woodyi]ACA84525.1 phenylacetate degradation, enoyl-CoA hydratase paaB [Shewanella woodyi ATCC 51908]
MDKAILLEKINGYACIKLNRPECLNSFNQQMHKELADILDVLHHDDSIRALILTGEGKGFCAGQDLSDRSVNQDDSPTDLGESVEHFYNPLIRRITAMPKPVICAVNGVAAGAGASIAMACDIVIAAKKSSFILSFSKVGLVPDSGASWHLPRAIGLPRAKALALLGNRLDADIAERWGLIWQVVNGDVLMETAHAMATELASRPTQAFANIKRLLNESFNSPMAQQMESERVAMQVLGFAHDYQEGVDAFLTKRTPIFIGK